MYIYCHNLDCSQANRLCPNVQTANTVVNDILKKRRKSKQMKKYKYEAVKFTDALEKLKDFVQQSVDDEDFDNIGFDDLSSGSDEEEDGYDLEGGCTKNPEYDRSKDHGTDEFYKQQESDFMNNNSSLKDIVSTERATDHRTHMSRLEGDTSAEAFISSSSVKILAKKFVAHWTEGGKNQNVIVCGIGKFVEGFWLVLHTIWKVWKKNVKDFTLKFLVIERDRDLIVKAEEHSSDFDDVDFVNDVTFLCKDIVFDAVIIDANHKEWQVEQFTTMLTFCRGMSATFYHKMTMLALSAAVWDVFAPMSTSGSRETHDTCFPTIANRKLKMFVKMRSSTNPSRNSRDLGQLSLR